MRFLEFILWVATVIILATVLQWVILPLMRNTHFIPYMAVVLLTGYVIVTTAGRLITYITRGPVNAIDP